MLPSSSSSSDLDRQLATLGHGQHLCLIYDDPADQLAVAASFLRSAVAAGDRCIYIADDESTDPIATLLAGAGLDLAVEQKRGALLLLTCGESYLRTGQFNPLDTIELLRAAVERARRDGFAGLRVLGEMTWALGNAPGCQRLTEYEALLNQFIPGSRAVALCQYDRQRFPPATVRDILRTHPRVILGRQLCDNLYYEPPEQVLCGEHDAERVQWMIDQLQRRQHEVAEYQRAEQALRQSEQRFSRFMQHLPGLAWIKDESGHYVYANEPAHKAFETQPGTLYGKTDVQVFDAETARRFMENDQRALRGDLRGVQVVETLEHPDGTLHYSLVTKFPIPDAAGPTLIGGMAMDITSQKQAEKAAREMERVYRAIGESIDYGVWICDPDGKNIYASETFLRLVGMTQEQCSNFGWSQVLHPHDAEHTLQAWKDCVRTLGIWDIEHRVRGVDGAYHPILARGVPVKDDSGQVICWAGINLDISRLKYAEQLLRDADRRKDEFLAMLAHELRNPLAPIRSGLDLLAMGEGSPEIIEIMQDQVTHLVRLVDDLLDVSRIMRGKVELRRQRVELASIVAPAIEATRPLFKEHRHELTCALPREPVWLNADPVRLTQVIANLLNNAAKYTNPGGQIELSARTEGAEVLIFVRDNGIGIDAALLPRVFDLFMQAQQTIDRSQGGLGIGLTVVKNLVELHDGTVSVHSAGPDQGSEFCVRLSVVPSK